MSKAQGLSAADIGKAATLPTRPALPTRLEHEYTRARALHLFAAFDTRDFPRLRSNGTKETAISVYGLPDSGGAGTSILPSACVFGP
jgi:hypothetical protein